MLCWFHVNRISVIWGGVEGTRVADISEQNAAFNYLPNEVNAYRTALKQFRMLMVRK
jgi:hypothetical protein